MTTFQCGGLTFRPLTEADLDLLLSWRNQERVRSRLSSDRVITAEEHRAWFVERDSETDQTFIVSDAQGPIGSGAIYEIDRDKNEATFGRVLIGEPRALGKRNGTILTLGLVYYAFRKLGLGRLNLTVRRDNLSAQRAYMAAGFMPGSHDDDAALSPSLMCMLALAPPERAWERWDDAGVVPAIEQAWQAEGERRHRRWLAAEIMRRIQPREDVVEYGCGSGHVYRELRALGLQPEDYYGYDVSYSMLAQAYTNHPDGWFAPGDLRDAHCNDVAICCEVIGHLPEARTALHSVVNAAYRLAVISLWVGDSPTVGSENVSGSQFEHRVYLLRDVLNWIREVARGARIEVVPGPDTTLLFVKRDRMPMHTVVMGSYNRPKLIRAAIASVKAQTRTSWQLIVTDDGSTEETLASIRAAFEGDPRCELLRFTGPSPTGPRPDAQVRAIQRINDALPYVRGELVHYLPDDDFYPPDRFEAFEQAFQDETVNMVYGRMRWAAADGTPTARDLFPGGPCVAPCGQVDHTSVVHRSSCLNVVPEWSTAGINYDSDGLFFLKLIQAGFGPIQPMDHLVAYHRDHGYNLIVTQASTTDQREP